MTSRFSSPHWLARILLVVFTSGCATSPPPKPKPLPIAVDGKTERGVSWMHGLYTGGPIYGPCTRVLSIDGGGIRGLIPAYILREIERQSGKPIAGQFDLIAGTSTGAILALGLTRPSDADSHVPAFRAQDLIDFYQRYGTKVFPNSTSLMRKLRRVFLPKYDANGIESVLYDYFSDVKMIEAIGRVIVPAYDIEERKHIWFDSDHGYDIYMRDVARGATAAPSYLPPARFSVPSDISNKGYVSVLDGGLFANNPSLVALEFAARIRPNSPLKTDTSLLLVSLGTGSNNRKYSFEEAWGWGLIDWVDPLLEIAFGDPAVEKRIENLMNGPNRTYVRFQLNLGHADIPLDDSSSQTIQWLGKESQKFIEENKKEIERIVAMLLLPRSPQCSPALGADYDRPKGPRRRREKEGSQ